MQQGGGLYPVLGALILMNVAFAYTEVFHNAMLPRIAPADKAGLISGLAFALGNLGGVSLMLLVLFAFALPGTVSLSWIADAPWLGIDQATHQQDRIVGPHAAELGHDEPMCSGVTFVFEPAPAPVEVGRVD